MPLQVDELTVTVVILMIERPPKSLRSKDEILARWASHGSKFVRIHPGGMTVDEHEIRDIAVPKLRQSKAAGARNLKTSAVAAVLRIVSIRRQNRIGRCAENGRKCGIGVLGLFVNGQGPIKTLRATVGECIDDFAVMIRRGAQKYVPNQIIPFCRRRIAPLLQPGSSEISAQTRKCGLIYRELAFLVKKMAIVVIAVHRSGVPDLFEIVDAVRTSPAFSCTLERGQKHGRENGDDGDDHQQFDQGEFLTHFPSLSGSEEVFGRLIVVVGFAGCGRALHELAEVCFGKFGGLVGELFHRSSPYALKNRTLSTLPSVKNSSA